jgi:ribosomal protein L37E
MEDDRQATYVMTKIEVKKTTPDLIAPCGMNCSLCRAYGRERKPCPGCRGDDSTETKTRMQCVLKNCEKLSDAGFDYCFSCRDFPCKSLLHLDTRYKTKYGMSVIENLASISSVGIQKFVKNENERWTCQQCGNMICVHKTDCCACGHAWSESLRNNAVPSQEDAPGRKPVR